MQKNLLFLALFFLTACSNDNVTPVTNVAEPFDHRDFAMGSFKIDVSHSYPHFNPTNNNHVPIDELNLRVYRSTYYDDELIIDGIRGECVYATMTGTEFDFSYLETSLRPENFGFRITPPCETCRIFVSGSGSVSENVRGLEQSNFSIRLTFSYDGFDLVRYSGSQLLDLPRPVLEASDCE